MKHPILLLIIAVNLLCTSCAKLPMESVELTQYLIDEGTRMHKMNIQSLNIMFNEKREKIDRYVKEVYTPKTLEKITANIDSTDKPMEVIPAILNAFTPEVISYRDQLQNELEAVRLKLVTKLNDDFKNFIEAANSLKGLLVSAVKVDEERQKLMDDIKKYTNNKIDFYSIESLIDKSITEAGDTGAKIKDLSDEIDKIMNN